MKTRVLVMTSLFALALMFAARSAQAQETMLVNVPFSFVAGATTLPAGEYAIQNIRGQAMLILRHYDEPRASAIVSSFATQSSKESSSSKVVFNRYGTRYFLSQLWISGEARGRQLPKSDREKEMAGVATAKLAAPEQVTVVARLVR